MKAGRWFAIAWLAIATLLAGTPAFGRDGYIKDQALLDKIQIGVTTKQEAIALLGPPETTADFDRRGIQSLGYWVDNWGKRLNISIDVDEKGIVRNIERLPIYGP